jgi:dTDP-glucose pyrophosphorylase
VGGAGLRLAPIQITKKNLAIYDRTVISWMMINLALLSARNLPSDIA